MRIILTLISIMLALATLNSQTAVSTQEISQLFDKPGKIKWLRHYKGRIDDLNDISVSLAYDGKHCRGQMIYLRSKEKFILKGSIDKRNILRLREIDEEGATSGYLLGEFSGQNILGEWQNYDNSIGGSLQLIAVNAAVEFPSYCGDNKWVHIYRGSIFPNKAELILQKDNDNSIRGIAFIPKEKKSFDLIGQLDENGHIELTLKDVNGQIEGSLSGHFNQDQTLEAEFHSPGGSKATAAFRLEEALTVGCIEYADYVSSYDITYPKTQSASFNRWIDELTGNWVTQCRNYAAEVKRINQERVPALRSTVRAFAWSDIDLYTNELISGVITFSNTWETSPKGTCFNFDLQNGQEITLEDIFESDFDYEKFIRQYINEKIGKHSLYRDYDYRKWLATEDFDFFTIRKEGISFSTRFNAIYGQQRVTIPYQTLKPYIKKKSPIIHLL